MSITLVKDATTVTLTGVRPASKKPLRKFQAHDRTAAGVLHVEDFGDEVRVFRVNVRENGTVKTELETFFNTEADGAVNTFTYTDENGSSHTVRWIDLEFNPQQIGYDFFDIWMTFEKVA